MAFAGGTAPDILEAGIVNLANRAKLEQFAAIDSYIDKWEEKSDILESVIEMGRVKDKIYGMGYAPAPLLFAWRKDYFKEAGLDSNTPPKNWEELKALSEKLTKKEGSKVVRAGFDVPKQSGQQMLQIFARQNGSAYVDEVKGEPLFDQPETVEAMEFLLSFEPDIIEYNMDLDDTCPFTKGNSAMSILGPDTIKNMMQNDPSLVENIGVVGCVPGKKAATFAGLRLYCIANTSKNKDASWDLIEFIMSKERMAERMKDFVPVRKSLIDEYVKLDPGFNQAVMDALAVGVGMPKVTWSPLIQKYVNQAYEQVMFKVKPADEALKEAVETLKKEIGQ